MKMKRLRKDGSEPTRKHSLKTNLMRMVVFCWILPFIAMIGAAGFYTSSQISGQIIANITDSVSASTEICAAQLESAVSASYAATYNTGIRTAYEKYVLSGGRTQQDQEALYTDVTNFLKQQYRYDSQFNMAMLYFSDQPDDLYYTYNDANGITFLKYQQYHTEVHGRIRKFAETLWNRVGFCCVDGNFYMVRNLVDSFTFKPYATLVMRLHPETFFENLTNVVYGEGATVWIGDSALPLKGEPISRREMEAAFADPKSSPSLIAGVRHLSTFDMRYAIRIDNSSMMAALTRFQWLMVLLCLLVIPLLALAFHFFNRNVTRPINRFLLAYRQLGKGEFGTHVDQSFPSLEFDCFSGAFNQMSDRLKSQFEQIYSDELALRDARIMALQAQINPHFLNNTLELINWEARMLGSEKISRMIEALATMLDAAMDRTGRHRIPLREELDYMDAYLYIIAQRLGSRLTVRKEIDESLYTCMVPRLVMQPILENAVEHGVEMQQNGMIVIRVYRRGESLCLEVENTGSMSEEDARRIKRLLSDEYDAAREHAASLGIHNVYQRLRILYGEQGNLTVCSNSQGNTLAKISLPLQYTQNNLSN